MIETNPVILGLIVWIISVGILWLLISSAVRSGVLSALRSHSRQQTRRSSTRPSSFDIVD